jgi:hypothetical protein
MRPRTNGGRLNHRDFTLDERYGELLLIGGGTGRLTGVGELQNCRTDEDRRNHHHPNLEQMIPLKWFSDPFAFHIM